MHSKRRQSVGLAAGGVLATSLDVTILATLVGHGSAVPVAAFLGSAAGAGAGYLFNKYVAFGDRSPICAAQLTRFATVALITATLMAVLMRLIAVELGVPYLLAKAVCAIAVFAAWSLPAQRRLVFRHQVRA